MKITRPFCRVLTALAFLAGISSLTAQSGNGLLLPFPADAKAGEASSPANAAPVPGRDSGSPGHVSSDTRRALELADTFLRRQQSEITNSVPRRGMTAPRVPARDAAPLRPLARAGAPQLAPLKTVQSGNLPMESRGGPSSELLPLPGEDAAGTPENTVLPDASAMLPAGQVMQTEGDSPPAPIEGTLPDGAVSREELAPGPAYGSIETQERRGPIFRVGGAEAMKLARSRGYKFTPAGGIGSRDGVHTAASQFPNVLTSEVHGIRMSQLRPPVSWKMEELSNTFFMFCDASYNAARLAPGWRIRGIRLEGPAWNWVICPRSGANTASFSIRIHAFKDQENASSVQLTGITLEGPDGATDWQDAFPDLNKSTTPAAPRAGETPPDPSASMAKGSGRIEPPLPE